jgi:hypothetical protein
MALSNQPLTQFAVLLLTGTVMSLICVALSFDLRGYLTSYCHRLWKSYQKPWYQKTFLWTKRSRAFYANEAKIRTTTRVVSVFGLAMGFFILAVEFAALVTGHVT